MKILYCFSIKQVSLIQIYILILEITLWTNRKGNKVFTLKFKERVEEAKVLTTNKGLYNIFLTAGLIWLLIYSNI